LYFVLHFLPSLLPFSNSDTHLNFHFEATGKQRSCPYNKTAVAASPTGVVCAIILNKQQKDAPTTLPNLRQKFPDLGRKKDVDKS